MKKIWILFLGITLVITFTSCEEEEFVEAVHEACDEFEENTSGSVADCTDLDVFLYSTGNAWAGGPGSPMGYDGETAPLWWFGYLMDGCNLKFLEHEISWGDDLPYLSRCEPHEIGNIDTWICDKVLLEGGKALYWRDQKPEYFDGKTHANAACGCHEAVILPDDYGEIGDPLYLKVTPLN